MKTILLKFAGPLQSWGTNSHFEVRHTDYYPSKSAVIGIIAASLGYGRDEDDKIRKLNEIKFAVRIDQPGNLIKDFHIARKYKPNGSEDRTYVTNRYYLEDAVFLAAISHEDEDFINEIEIGLRSPYFQPFMGRRSLPMSADFIIDVMSENIIDALKQYEWQAAKWYKKKYAHELINLEMYADSDLLDDKPNILRKDRVISFSQKERKFSVRYESKTSVKVFKNQYSDNNSSEHDIWGVVGE